MEDTKNPETAGGEQEKSFFGIIIHSFFIIPFLIAVFALLLFAAVRILTHEQQTVYDYLNDVKTGALTKRWQAAFELSKILTNSDLIPKEDRFIDELKNAFEQAQHDDNRVRQYLALAMGRTGNQTFVEPLVGALKHEKQENLYAVIYALGMLRDKSSAVVIHPFLEYPDSKIRLAAVIALGSMGNQDSIALIKKVLHDSEPNVQWDAAIALAKMGDTSGKEILLKLLDRPYLSGFEQIDAEEQNHILLVVLEAAQNLNDPQLDQAIVHLGQLDQNMNVRKKALEVAQ